ncbi:MAG: carboxypeptidase-like regulatory domain-containing protein, partial [Bacteroidales bacterium]
MGSRSVSLALCLFSFAVAAYAAAGDGSIRGHVSDPDGLALPGVTVSVRPSSGPPVVVVSDANGDFLVAAAPGEYQVSAELEGFDAVQQA